MSKFQTFQRDDGHFSLVIHPTNNSTRRRRRWREALALIGDMKAVVTASETEREKIKDLCSRVGEVKKNCLVIITRRNTRRRMGGGDR